MIGECSPETGLLLAVLGASVRLGVALLDASGLAPMSLGLAHGRSSKKESVRAYYNYILQVSIETERDHASESGDVPEGDFMISSSIVRQDPPALVILARAPSVKRRAATSSLGSSRRRMSSVTVPTTTAVLPVLSLRCLTSLLRETGGLMVREATNLLRMVLQKLDSVLLDRNLKSCAKKQNSVRHAMHCAQALKVTYSHEEMLIKILAFGVLLGLLLNSASFIQVDTLKESRES